MRVLLIGSYPPPLGGVSVFLGRYRRQLEREGHTVDVIDPHRFAKAALYRELSAATRRGYDLISLNFPSIHMMALLLLAGRAGRTEVWDHNWRVLESWGAARRKLYSLFLGRARELVLVAPHLKDYYFAHGVALPARTRVQHAFLPPPEEDEAGIVATYPPEVQHFISRARPLVVANAFRLVFRDGVDLYGLDMCVRLTAALKHYHPGVGLLFALADAGDGDELRRAEVEIDALGLGQNFRFLTGQRELWPLFKRARLMVRPTATDGYALSVAEALHFGCPVVASDVSERPAGTIIFAARDEEDFTRKCLEALGPQNPPAP